MGLYIGNNNNKINKIFINPSGEMKRVTSVWVNRVGMPAKVFSLNQSIDPSIDPDTIAPINEIGNWDYTLNENNDTITLNYWTNSYYKGNVIVYAHYKVGEKIYRTKLSNNDNKRSSRYMFCNARIYGSISFQSGIDTSDVTCMSYMFNQAVSDADSSIILDNLDTSHVTDMSSMFYNCNCYNCPIDVTPLNVSNVTNMGGMFSGYMGTTIIGLDKLDTGKVIDVSNMFSYCDNLKLINFIKYGSNLATMEYVFINCKKLTSVIFPKTFTTRQVSNYYQLFYGCSELTSLDLTSFATPSYQNKDEDWKMVYGMFGGADKLSTVYVDKDLWTVPRDSYGMFDTSSTAQFIYK